MRTYLYKARTESGTAVAGTLRAESLAAALLDLSRRGHFPMEVRRGAAPGTRRGRSLLSRRVSPKDLTLFTRQLTDLLEADIPLLRALEIVREQTVRPRLALIVEELRRLIGAGKSLSEAAAAFPGVFPPLYVSLIRAGELGGEIGGALRGLAEYLENEEEVKSRLRAALAYPLLVAAVGVGTVIFLTAVVVPQLDSMFLDLGQPLPWVTRAVVRGSRWLVRYGWAAALALAGGSLALKSRIAGSARVDGWFLRWPLIGHMLVRSAAARFARTLSILLSGGVPLPEAVRVVSDVMGNSFLRRQALEAAGRIHRGISLAESLRGCRHFPALLHQMAAIGEESGSLEKSLGRAAAVYEREADRSVKTLLSLLEPVLLLSVGGVVVATLLPIFQIPVLAR